MQKDLVEATPRDLGDAVPAQSSALLRRQVRRKYFSLASCALNLLAAVFFILTLTASHAPNGGALDSRKLQIIIVLLLFLSAKNHLRLFRLARAIETAQLEPAPRA